MSEHSENGNSAAEDTNREPINSEIRATIYLVVILTLTVLVVEIGLMLAIDRYSTLSPVENAFIDGLMLIFTLFPLLYFGVVKPMARQIIRRAKTEQQLKVALHYDLLTGLPNRALIKDRLAYSIEIAKRESHDIVLILLDINQLQQVNDTLGHSSGDQIIKGLAHRLTSAIRKSDSIARVASDEFLIILPKASLEYALEVTRKLSLEIEEPFSVNGSLISIEITMGVAAYPNHGNESNVLIQRADVALRVAKQQKDEVSVYKESNDKHTLNRLTLVNDIRTSLSDDTFFLHYQPKVELQAETICGVEALVRWNHWERGLVYPDSFIPCVEKTGLIRPFTDMTLVKAFAQAKQWQIAQSPLKVAVNISARLLHDSTFPRRILSLIEQADLAPEFIELEITESAVIANPELAEDILNELHTAGFSISIDDFGTGYTSLSYLSRLPVSFLKIDRCFVVDMLSNERHAVITNSIIELGHNLGMKVIAEGVEEEDTCTELKILGCDIIQGYYYSKPLPAQEFPHLLKKWDLNNASPLGNS